MGQQFGQSDYDGLRGVLDLGEAADVGEDSGKDGFVDCVFEEAQGLVEQQR